MSRGRVSTVTFSYYLLIITAFSDMTPCCLAYYPLHNIYFHSLPSISPRSLKGLCLPLVRSKFRFVSFPPLPVYTRRSHFVTDIRFLRNVGAPLHYKASHVLCCYNGKPLSCEICMYKYVAFDIDCRTSMAVPLWWEVQDMF